MILAVSSTQPDHAALRGDVLCRSIDNLGVLEKFVEDGGKVLVCYSLPERLG